MSMPSSFAHKTPKYTIYQCLDGAVVIKEGGEDPEVLTMESALLKYKGAPIIKLEDMNVKMVECFRQNYGGIDVLEGLSPNCPKDDIPYDNNSPASYSYIQLVAMSAAAAIGVLGAHGATRESWQGRMDILLDYVAKICVEDCIYPYE